MVFEGFKSIIAASARLGHDLLHFKDKGYGGIFGQRKVV